jgi:hypothetical protein
LIEQVTGHNLTVTLVTEICPDYYIIKTGWTSAQIMKLGGKSIKTKNARSVTPRGFAEAFFQANP